MTARLPASRRTLLLGLVALPGAAQGRAAADAALEAAMRELVGEGRPQEGGMALRLPALPRMAAWCP